MSKSIRLDFFWKDNKLGEAYLNYKEFISFKNSLLNNIDNFYDLTEKYVKIDNDDVWVDHIKCWVKESESDLYYRFDDIYNPIDIDIFSFSLSNEDGEMFCRCDSILSKGLNLIEDLQYNPDEDIETLYLRNIESGLKYSIDAKRLEDRIDVGLFKLTAI